MSGELTFRSARIELVPADVVGGGWASSPHFLRLVAANGVVLAASEWYASRAAARRSARSWIRAMEDITHEPDMTKAVREVEQE